MIELKIMAEYECSPTWQKRTEDILFENIPIDGAPFSKRLKVKIREWDTVYQSTYNAENPQDSGFSSNSEEVQFEENGLQLTKEINKEIGAHFVVTYRNVMTGITHYPPDY